MMELSGSAHKMQWHNTQFQSHKGRLYCSLLLIDAVNNKVFQLLYFSYLELNIFQLSHTKNQKRNES